MEIASIERLRQAREVAMALAGLDALLVMHGLLMPDTRAWLRCAAESANSGRGRC